MNAHSQNHRPHEFWHEGSVSEDTLLQPLSFPLKEAKQQELFELDWSVEEASALPHIISDWSLPPSSFSDPCLHDWIRGESQPVQASIAFEDERDGPGSELDASKSCGLGASTIVEQAATWSSDFDQEFEPIVSSTSRSSIPNPVSSVSGETWVATGPGLSSRSILDCEDQLLVHLRDDLGKDWRESAALFSMQVGKMHSVPALQMRYQRLQKKLRQWNADDVLLLQRAHAFWKTHKWQLISQKMNELAAATSNQQALSDVHWSAKSCAEKWRQLQFELSSSPSSGE